MQKEDLKLALPICCTCRHHTLERENHGKHQDHEAVTNTNVNTDTVKGEDKKKIRLLMARSRSRILGYGYIQTEALSRLRCQSLAGCFEDAFWATIPGVVPSLFSWLFEALIFLEAPCWLLDALKDKKRKQNEEGIIKLLKSFHLTVITMPCIMLA